MPSEDELGVNGGRALASNPIVSVTINCDR